MNKDNKEMIPWYFTVVFFGVAVFNTFLWIDAADARDALEKSLAACQQENAALRRGPEIDENFEALVEALIREHEMARPCYPNCPKEVLNLTRYREACRAVPACEAKVILDEEAPR